MTAPYMPPPAKKSRLGLVLALVIGSLILATIGSAMIAFKGGPKWPDSKPSRSPEAMPQTDAALATYYDQKLSWSPCGSGNECAKLTVPLDYDSPDGRTIKLALLKVPAGDEAIGSLVINPGGPGGSGVGYASYVGTSWPRDLTDNYDIVGFDPRGVGKSAPLKCLSTKQMDELVAADPDPDTRAERDNLDRLVRVFGEGCLKESGELPRHMSTVEVAKDLDVLRQALGEGKLDYFGASYGTLIGATYANMFPTHVGRMVLDGAVDPALSNAELAMQQAGGFETALRAYVADCTKHSKCVLGNDVETGLARIRRLLADIEQRPLPTDSSRDLEIGNAYIGIWLPLYVKDYWPSLTRALDEAITKGRGTQLLELADQYVGRGPSSYNDNSMEVLYAVNCLDHSDSIPTKQVPKYFAEFEKVSPTFGKAFAFSLSTCAEWPVQSGQVTKAMAAAGAPPIVVVGTTRDPATPYQWAVNLADELDSGVLISRDGDGHTGYNSNNSCVDDAINAYLVDGEVPKDGLKCAEE